MAFAGKDCSPDKKTGFHYKGREIILSKTRGRPMHPHWKKGYYTDKERIEAVALYAATGSYPRVAELTGISQASLRGWAKEPWFHALLDEIRAENDHQIDAKFNEIIVGALDQLGDRVLNGDLVLNKDGELVRKPVGARDLSIVTAINIDKRQLLRGKPTSRTEAVTNQSVEARLANLANEFKKLTGRAPKPPEIVDAEFTRVEAQTGPVDAEYVKEEDNGRIESTEGMHGVQVPSEAREGSSSGTDSEAISPDGPESDRSEHAPVEFGAEVQGRS